MLASVLDFKVTEMNKADTNRALMDFLFCEEERQLNNLIPEYVIDAVREDCAMLWKYITQETPEFGELGKSFSSHLQII